MKRIMEFLLSRKPTHQRGGWLSYKAQIAKRPPRGRRFPWWVKLVGALSPQPWPRSVVAARRAESASTFTLRADCGVLLPSCLVVKQNNVILKINHHNMFFGRPLDRNIDILSNDLSYLCYRGQAIIDQNIDILSKSSPEVLVLVPPHKIESLSDTSCMGVPTFDENGVVRNRPNETFQRVNAS